MLLNSLVLSLNQICDIWSLSWSGSALSLAAKVYQVKIFNETSKVFSHILNFLLQFIKLITIIVLYDQQDKLSPNFCFFFALSYKVSIWNFFIFLMFRLNAYSLPLLFLNLCLYLDLIFLTARHYHLQSIIMEWFSCL